MPYEVYKLIHILGLLLIYSAMGALILRHAVESEKKFEGRKGIMITHGVGLALMLVAGFGLLARLGLTNGLPVWVYLKLAIWFVLGGFPVLIYKLRGQTALLFTTMISLGLLAAFLAVYKPFA